MTETDAECQPAKRLQGQVALITGAGRGIGRAIALAFAREGADVAINYQREQAGAAAAAQEAQSLGVRALVVPADVSQSAQVEAMVARTVGELGRVDILVNNAAVFNSVPLLQVTEELWDRTLGVNLKGTFLCAQAVARIMLRQGSGNIINLASGAGLSATPGYDVSVVYAASRAGVVMLTRRLALELAPKIRVNCLAPGIVDSKRRPMREDVRQRFASLTPLRRVANTGDIADAAVFLASSASDFITGQVLSVDGGLVMR